MMAPAHPHPIVASPFGVVYAVGLLVAVFAVMIVLAFVIRKFLRDRSRSGPDDWSESKPDTDNASAFMTASMQGVIEKLRTQEKELARLHLVAQESERLTEEVTRNMPTGLLLVSATGAIGSSNPAAEEALGMRPLRYRSYKDVLGTECELTRMLTACLKDGQTFQRAEVEHVTPEGEARHLGVTISPIFRPVRNMARAAEGNPASAPEKKVSGALCLMSDLTELTALQKQIRWKENLAAL